MLAALDEAEADLKAGRYTDYTDETLPKLATSGTDGDLPPHHAGTPECTKNLATPRG